jgi:hypothetical protein
MVDIPRDAEFLAYFVHQRDLSSALISGNGLVICRVLCGNVAGRSALPPIWISGPIKGTAL